MGTLSGKIASNGLTPTYVNSATNASAGKLYQCDTSSSAFTVTLPTGTTGSVLRFVDAKGTWATNNMTIAPAATQTIQGISGNGSLVCDLSGAYVEMTWDATDSQWVVQTTGFQYGPPASATLSGILTVGAQTLAGSKTWNDTQTFKASGGATQVGSYGTDGAWSFGNGASYLVSNYHGFFGSVRSNAGTGGSGCFFARNGGNLELNNGAYIDSGNVRATSTAAGYTRVLVSADGTSTDPALRIFSTTASQTADAVITAGTQILNVTMAGAWQNISGGSWGTISDARLKTDVSDVTDGLTVITSLRPVHYTWKNPDLHETAPTTNFLAQEVREINPEWVVETTQDENADTEHLGGDKPLNVHMTASFNAYLVAAIKELAAENRALKERIERLEASK